MTNYIGITSASYCHSWAIMGISSIFRILKKSRYYRLLKFLKKSKLLKLAPCRCCVYFVHPEGWNSFRPNLHFRTSKSYFVVSISEKSPIWRESAISKIEVVLAMVIFSEIASPSTQISQILHSPLRRSRRMIWKMRRINSC